MKPNHALPVLIFVAITSFGLFSPSAFAAPEASSSSTSSSSGQATNIRISPLGLLIGYLNLDVDFKINGNWSLGPTVSYWRFDFGSTSYVGNNIKNEITAFGARGTWAKNGTFQTGLYVSPMFQILSARASGTSISTGREITASATIPIITGLIGYQWYGANWNVNTGGGLVIGASSAKVDVTDGTSSTSVEVSRSGGLAFDIMVGYAF